MGYSWDSARCTSIQTVLTIRVMVFSCVASQNKQGRIAWDRGGHGYRADSLAKRRAPGLRGDADAALWHSGNHGFIWASTINETNAIRLALSTRYLDSNNSHTRAHGFQLRCLSE